MLFIKPIFLRQRFFFATNQIRFKHSGSSWEHATTFSSGKRFFRSHRVPFANVSSKATTKSTKFDCVHRNADFSPVKTNILNEKNLSPLHLATELNRVKALQLMGKHRNVIDIQQGGEHGRTALHLAAIYDHEECARILVSSCFEP